MILKAILNLTVFIFSTLSFACTCVYPGPLDDDQYKSYDLIGEGIVVKIEEHEFSKTIHFQIQKKYKGEIDSLMVKIETGKGSEICGLNVKPDQQWLIFAYWSEGIYRTSLCTRSRRLNREDYMYGSEWRYQKKIIRADRNYLNKHIRVYDKS